VLVAPGDARSQVLRRWFGHRLALEQQVGARQLAIEVLCELRCVVGEPHATLIAVGVADLPHPAVLEHREHDEQPEEGSRDDAERQTQTRPHVGRV
jgi:hypothetical protein